LPFRVVASIRQKVGAPSERNILKKRALLMRVDESVSGVRITTEAARSSRRSLALSSVFWYFFACMVKWRGRDEEKERVFSSSAPLFRFFFPQ
jgi:hypothetical protein